MPLFQKNEPRPDSVFPERLKEELQTLRLADQLNCLRDPNCRRKHGLC